MLTGIVTFPFVSGPMTLWKIRKAEDFIEATQSDNLVSLRFGGDKPEQYLIPTGYILTWTQRDGGTLLEVMKREEWEKLVKDNPLHLR